MSLTGTWGIVEMDLWDREDIDLIGLGFIEFSKDRAGQFRFIAVEGWMDVTLASTTGVPALSSPGTATTRAITSTGGAGPSWRTTVR